MICLAASECVSGPGCKLCAFISSVGYVRAGGYGTVVDAPNE